MILSSKMGNGGNGGAKDPCTTTRVQYFSSIGFCKMYFGITFNMVTPAFYWATNAQAKTICSKITFPN